MKLMIDQEITLQQISPQYATGLFQLVQSNMEKGLCYWCPDLKRTFASLPSTLAHIEDANSKFKDDRTPDFLIFYRDTLAGLISLSPIDVAKSKSEIGYWLGSDFEGNGLVSRAFPAILKYAKETLCLKTVELSTSAPNLRSQKIPSKFGFHKARLVPNAEKLEDQTVDHIVWAYHLAEYS